MVQLACFTAPPDFTFGDERAWIRGCGSEGIDNSTSPLFKRTKFAANDRLGLEFRTEFFNIFNRTQFAPANTICCTANNKNFGVVTSTASGTNPR